MTTLDTIDLSDHDAFLDAVPHEWFRTLRHEAPVAFRAGHHGRRAGLTHLTRSRS